MDRLSQLAAVIAIAAGAGLCTFSRHLDPPISAANAANVVASGQSVGREDRHLAAFAGGWGTAFITLGVLGLIVPWINIWVRYQSAGTAGIR